MQVIIYSQDGCPTCDRAKEWYRRQGIPFEERDVFKNEKWQKEAEELSPSHTVPVIIRDGQVEQGFNGKLG